MGKNMNSLDDTKKWKIFEKVVKRIYDILLSDFRIDAIHGINITGKSGTKHQIDVFVKVHMPHMISEEIVSCKYWKRAVNKAHVAEFSSLRGDINANQATIISRNGFQSGAIKFAKAEGINLYRIYLPEEMGVKTAVFNTKGLVDKVVNLNVHFLFQSEEQAGKSFTEEHSLSKYNELTVYDKDDKPESNIFDLIDEAKEKLKIARENDENVTGIHANKKFFNGSYMIKGDRKEIINYIDLDIVKVYVDQKKEVFIEKDKLLIHDLTRDKMMLVEKPVDFSLLEM